MNFCKRRFAARKITRASMQNFATSLRMTSKRGTETDLPRAMARNVEMGAVSRSSESLNSRTRLANHLPGNLH